MKKLALGLLVLVVVLVAAVLGAPSFIDWNAQKDRIAGEVRKATGRELSIEGDVSLTLLPAPAFSAAGVKLANIAGGSHPAMLELEALKVRVAPLPLLSGDVQVQSITLLKPVIRLEVLPDGRRNWDLGVPGEDGAARPRDGARDRGAPGAGVPGRIRLDRVTITDGTLIYRDAATGREERIDRLNARIAADSLRGPFAASGDAVVRGIAAEFEANSGRLLDRGATPLNLGIRMPDAAASARFGGAVSLHGEQTSLRGRVTAEGEDLAAVIAALSGEAGLLPALAKPFAVVAQVSAGPDQASASDLVLRFGDTSVEGDVQVDLGPPVDGQIRLAASRIDLDKLLAEPAGEAAAAPDAPPASAAPGADGAAGAAGASAVTTLGGAAVTLPDDIAGSLEVTVDALVYRGQVVRQILLSAGLADGRVRLAQALALLPGGSDVNVTGTLGPVAADGRRDLRFDGRIEAASDNLRAVLDWFGVDVAAVPRDRLRKMNLTANVAGTARQATFSDIDLRLDVSRAMGGIAVILRERPGLGIGLAVDKFNLDAYLPKDAAATGDGAAAPSADGADGPPAEEGAEVPDTAPALAALGTFDANLDFRLGGLTVRGISVADVHLDATLEKGTVTVREARAGDLAGAAVRVSGTIADLTARPSFDAALDLQVADPVRLAKAANLPAGTPAGIGPFDVAGTVKGSKDLVAFDGQLTALGGRVGAVGTARPWRAPPDFEISLTAEHPSLAQVARALAPDLALGSALGGLNLSARMLGTPDRVEISALAGALGPLQVSGSLAADLAGPGPAVSGLDLLVELRHPDVARLARAVAPGVTLAPDLGGVDLKARVGGSSTVVQVTDLAGRLGTIDLSGSLGVDLSGGKPALDLDLATGPVPVGTLMAPAAAGGPAPSAAGAGGGTPSAVRAARGERWSRKPIDLSALSAVDAEVTLHSEALLFDHLRLDDAVVEATLADGRLDLRRIDGTAYDGAVSVSGEVDARDGIRADLAVKATGLNLAELLADLAETERVAGPLNLDASLTSRGRSEAELIGALSGDGKLDGTLTVTAGADEQAGTALRDLLGQKIREIRGVTDATDLLIGAFSGTPGAVRGTFTVERGVVRTADLRIDGRHVTALTQGTADLPAWRLDTRTDVFRAEDPDTPYITAELHGPLDEPNPRIKGKFLKPPEDAAPGETAPAAETPTEAEPDESLKKDLEQRLKGLLKGLGN